MEPWSASLSTASSSALRFALDSSDLREVETGHTQAPVFPLPSHPCRDCLAIRASNSPIVLEGFSADSSDDARVRRSWAFLEASDWACRDATRSDRLDAVSAS